MGPRLRTVAEGKWSFPSRASTIGLTCPQRESIEAHLTIVFAAMAVGHYIETQTGWSIKKFVRTTRRYRTVQIKAGRQILTAADPLPDDLRDALATIGRAGVH